jgi:hypothetical protein
MKLKVRATTLIETLIYIGLFGIIFGAILQFTLMISESSQNAEYRNELDRATILVTEHLSESFDTFDSIDLNNSFFYQDNGKIKLIKGSNSYSYSILNNRLRFDRNGVINYLINPNVNIQSFYLERITAADSTITGVRVKITLYSVKKPTLTKTVQTNYFLK